MMFQSYILFSLQYCYCCLSLSMWDFKIGTLNLNGARDNVTRAAFLKSVELKRIDLMSIQETHSDLTNESHGNIILSHKNKSSECPYSVSCATLSENVKLMSICF